MIFLSRLKELVSVAIPNYKSPTVACFVVLTIFLVVRTVLSIKLADVTGNIVKAIIEKNFLLFIQRLFILLGFAVPASFINSALEYMNKYIASQLRKNMTQHFNQKYTSGKVYYQMTNLDQRIENPDQRLTQDIDKWCTSLSNLYSNITKPLLDLILFSKKLSSVVGWEGPTITIAWYLGTGIIMKLISPPFGLLTAIEQKKEGEYRSMHSSVVNYSEEIAFYRGSPFEVWKLNEKLEDLISHSRFINYKRFFMGIYDSLLSKYGATIVGYTIVGFPVFGRKSEQYLEVVQDDAAQITKDYVRNTSLLVNLAKAIGRIVVSYKEVQSLAGYTHLVFELKRVMDDMEKGTFVKKILNEEVAKNRGKIKIVSQPKIVFNQVPIATPNGEVLVPSLSFKIEAGQHVFIKGPNGCGKSSILRILGELWPIFGGIVEKPKNIFYIPQRPYLPYGTLREEIIYPDTVQTMKEVHKKTDEDLLHLMQVVGIPNIVEREGGWDSIKEWFDILSGGEKQRVALARALYHRPQFAILGNNFIQMNVLVQFQQKQKEKSTNTSKIQILLQSPYLRETF